MQQRFHRPGYIDFKTYFPASFENQIILSYKSFSENWKLEKSISDVLIAFSSSFCNYRTMDAQA